MTIEIILCPTGASRVGVEEMVSRWGGGVLERVTVVRCELE
jgi:hypothetical protein